MKSYGIPKTEHAVAMLEKYFFARTDKVGFLADWGKPCPTLVKDNLEALLRAHVQGKTAPPAVYRHHSKKRVVASSGHHRLGSYTPAPPGNTPWLCIDFDGDGHADALLDPEASALKAYKAFTDRGIPVYLEKSGGGKGWHLWCFFTELVPAKKARRLAFALAPRDSPLANDDFADPRRGRGIEVFPKQTKIRKNGYGNLVWLPWWSGAAEGGNTFFQLNRADALAPHIPTEFEAIDEAAVDRILEDFPEPARKSKRKRKKKKTTENTSPDADGTADARATQASEQLQNPTGEESFSGAWAEWRNAALQALDLEDVYGEWLTGNSSGEGWIECRDPDSSSGDQDPSAGVADGSGEAERGAFHSFISGETFSVFDFLVARGEAENFRQATRRIADLTGVPIPSGNSPFPTAQSTAGGYRRPDIRINNRQLRDILADAWGAVRAANTSEKFRSIFRPFLYQRSGALVRLAMEDDGPRIEGMTDTSTFGVLVRVANWLRVTDEAIIDSPPPKDVARDMMVNPEPWLPRLEAVVTTPVFGREGNLIAEPGYHPHDRLWLFLSKSVPPPDVPEKISKSDIAAARNLLCDELLGDFPFLSESDRAHIIAAMVLPFVRRMIDGCTPLHLVEAPTAGSGKGLLCNLTSLIATGAEIDAQTLSNNEDEARKMLTAQLSKGRPIILLDNASDRYKVNSPPLASVLTTQSWTDRILGKTEMITLPNKATWMLTANNPKLSMEIARRCIRIRIDPHMDRPWRRAGFRHPNIVGWAKENRRELVRALLILVRAWLTAGKPLFDVRLGSFERWSSVVGGILEVAGISGFLGNLEVMYEEADVEGRSWREFTAAWWEAMGDRPVKVQELNDLCDELDLMSDVRGDGTYKSQQIRLGKALASARDRVFNEFRVLRQVPRLGHKGSNSYLLAREPQTSVPGNGECSPKWGVDSQLPNSLTASDESGCDEKMGSWGVGECISRARAGIHTHTHIHARARARDELPANSPTPQNSDVSSSGQAGNEIGECSETPHATPQLPKLPGDEIDLANLPTEWDSLDPPPPEEKTRGGDAQ